MIYAQNVSVSGVNRQTRARMSVATPEIGLGLSIGTPLCAGLESAASTACELRYELSLRHPRTGRINRRYGWSQSRRAHSSVLAQREMEKRRSSLV